MQERRPFIAGNWKMYKTPAESVQTVRQLIPMVSDIRETDIMIAPPFPALAAVGEMLKGSNIALGGQNMFWENEGAYTGEVSPGMLTAAGCTYVIIGHSERRQFFGETDQTVNKKLKAAAAAKLVAIMCVGETEQQRDAEKTFSVLDKQMEKGLEGLSLTEDLLPVIAYEPVWAIGTGKTAKPEQVQEVHAYLRKFLGNRFGNALANRIRILYGGSVKPDNISGLMALEDVDGALVGGASLDPEKFAGIIHF